MELRQLKHFLAVVEHQHFGRAAASVGLTQQALSHSILKLERSLQVKLLNRGKSSVEPTYIGRMFEKRARMICSEAEFASAEVMSFKGGAEGHIRVGATPNFSTHILPQAILRFAKIRPQIRVTVVIGTSKQLFDQVAGGKLEFCVTSPIRNIESYTELNHTPVAGGYLHDPSYVVMSPRHPLGANETISLRDLGSYSWVMPESFLAPWESIFGLMRELGAAAPKYVVRTDSLTFAKSLVLQSNFISLLGAESVAIEVEAGLLLAKRLNPGTGPVPAFVSFHKTHPPPQATLVLANCVEKAIAAHQAAPAVLGERSAPRVQRSNK